MATKGAPRVDRPDTRHLNLALHVGAGEATVITVIGELDLATAPLFEAAVRELRCAGPRSVILDLQQLEFIDLSGMRSILGLQTTCDRNGASLTIRPGPRRVQRLFELTGTDRLLSFAET